MKVLLDYDPVTGLLTQPATMFSFTIGTSYSLAEHKAEKSSGITIDDMIKLKASGFTAEDILLLRNE